MQIIAKIILFLFLICLVVPSVVSVFDKNTDNSAYYNLSEEELSHKVFCCFQTSHDIINFFGIVSGIIISEKLSKHDKLEINIFIPPPEEV